MSLLTACDVLVLKVLETMGKWIVRVERSRFKELGDRPLYLAHTLWQADDATVDKALRGAWQVTDQMVSTHGCCGVTYQEITDMLDEYVHDLVITGTPHTIEQLRYRFFNRLGLDHDLLSS